MTAHIKKTGMHLATAWLLFCRRRSSFASISAPTMLSTDFQAHSLGERELSRRAKVPWVVACLLVPFKFEWLVTASNDGVMFAAVAGRSALRKCIPLPHLHFCPIPSTWLTCMITLDDQMVHTGLVCHFDYFLLSTSYACKIYSRRPTYFV